jgi:Sulfatase
VTQSLTAVGEQTDREARPSELDLAASVLALTALAAIQPVLDVLGRAPEFFVARASPPSDVILVAIALGIGIPVLMALLVVGVHRIDPTAGRFAHGAIVIATVCLLTVAVLPQGFEESIPGWVALALGAVVGLLTVWAYWRASWLRTLLRYAAVAPIVVVAVFLFVAPTSALAWPAEVESDTAAAVPTEPAPIVLLVFDEFPIASVIDRHGAIQSEYFPNLARLAREWTWFSNAVTVNERTEEALPTIVSGEVAPTEGKVPRAADYPNTLFTLLGRSYEIRATETVTELCPVSVCAGQSRVVVPASQRWASLMTDLSIVSGHVLLPEAMAASLPPIDQSWGNFGTGTVASPEWNIRDRFFALVDADRRNDVGRFLDGLDHPLWENEFHFAHLPVPHNPWEYLPDGRVYPSATDGPLPTWRSNDWLVEQLYQRHLIQVQYADTIVGEMIERLEATDSYNEALVVVLADHGAAFRAGVDRREITAETVGDIAAVPLFIKRPDDRDGGVDDYRAETVDIAPTIADLIGAEINWPVDGVSLFDPDKPPRAQSTMIGKEVVTFGSDGHEKVEVARRHLRNFGHRGPFGLAPKPMADLMDRNVNSLEISDDPSLSSTLDQKDAFTDLDPLGDPLPAQITGTLTGGPEGRRWLAIALNGRIVAVTRTGGYDDPDRFVAMIPPAAIRQSNQFAIILVDGTGEDRTLLRAAGT